MDDNPVARVLGPVCRTAAIVAGWSLFALAILTCVEIVGRKLFAVTLHGVDEMSGYALAMVSAIGFSYALLRRAHTRIDVVLVHLPPPARVALNLAASLALAAFAVFACLRGWSELADSIDLKSVSSTPLQTPLWLPQSIWVAGLALFALVACALAAQAMWLAATDRDRLDRLYGPPTARDEIDAEIAARRGRGPQ